MNEQQKNIYRKLAYEQRATANALNQATFHKQFSTAQNQRLETQLQRIENALQRFVKGDFGICQKCGAEIQRERLIMLPYAELCIECQHQQEKNGSFGREKY